MKFFFNLLAANTIVADEVGIEIPTVEKAIIETISLLRDVAMDCLILGEEAGLDAIAILDERGLQVEIVYLRDVLMDILPLFS